MTPLPLSPPRKFHCPKWPDCQCPEGTVRADCPGLLVMPADNDPQAAATVPPRRPVSSKTLIRDMDALFDRCDRSMQELAAFQTELAMIIKDMSELHGLPLPPEVAGKAA